MKSDQEPRETGDALCPECGHAFKTYIDRILGDERKVEAATEISCPVCGCGKCSIGEI